MKFLIANELCGIFSVTSCIRCIVKDQTYQFPKPFGKYMGTNISGTSFILGGIENKWT